MHSIKASPGCLWPFLGEPSKVTTASLDRQALFASLDGFGDRPRQVRVTKPVGLAPIRQIQAYGAHRAMSIPIDMNEELIFLALRDDEEAAMQRSVGAQPQLLIGDALIINRNTAPTYQARGLAL
jgi:hypothetical protein